MDAVLSYIYDQTENRTMVMLVLHELLSSIPGITCRISYNIPFYYRNKGICYLNPVKKDGVELAFIHGLQLSNSQGLLQHKGRKQIAGVTFHFIEEVPFHQLTGIIQEAILLDDMRARKK